MVELQDLPEWERLLAAERHLQLMVPGSVLVGGTAASLHAGHRVSLDGALNGIRQLRRTRPLGGRGGTRRDGGIDMSTMKLERSRALWNRESFDLSNDETLAQILDRGEVEAWRELYRLASRDTDVERALKPLHLSSRSSAARMRHGEDAYT